MVLIDPCEPQGDHNLQAENIFCFKVNFLPILSSSSRNSLKVDFSA